MTRGADRLAEIVASSGARRVAFLGIAKNVGKTTALLAVLERLVRQGNPIAAVSAGRDGEAVDAITGEPKPRYRVTRGLLIASARAAFEAASFEAEFVRTLPFTTRFGPIEVRRARGEGEVEMIGPSTASELAETCAALEAEGAQRVLVDGALSRRAFASARVCDAVVLSVGLAAGSSAEAAVEAARAAAELVLLPVPPAALRVRSVEGAVSDALVDSLGVEGGDVVVGEDFSSFFLSPSVRSGLARRRVSLAVRRPARLLAVTVNPTAPARAPVDAQRFRALVARALPDDLPVVDVESG